MAGPIICSILPRAAIRCISRPRSTWHFIMGCLSSPHLYILQLLPATSGDCHQNNDGDTDGDHDGYQDHEGDDDFGSGVFFIRGVRS
jgi:hypothetical protein